MVSQKTRNVIWRNYVDASQLRSRYAALANRCGRYSASLRAALLIAVLGCAASLVAPISHPAAAIALATAAAILGIADFALNLAKRSEVLRQISVDVGRLEVEWRKLVFRIDRDGADDSEFRSEDSRLKSRLLDATNRCCENAVVADGNPNQWAYPTLISLSATPRRPSPNPPPPPPPPRPAPPKKAD